MQCQHHDCKRKAVAVDVSSTKVKGKLVHYRVFVGCRAHVRSVPTPPEAFYATEPIACSGCDEGVATSLVVHVTKEKGEVLSATPYPLCSAGKRNMVLYIKESNQTDSIKHLAIVR